MPEALLPQAAPAPDEDGTPAASSSAVPYELSIRHSYPSSGSRRNT